MALMRLLIISLILITNQAFAVCSTRAVGDNTRIISLAKDYAEQANSEFKKQNFSRGCELLHVSQSFITQSDNQKLINQIGSLYETRCGMIKTDNT
jgi:hypothetical protein